MTITTSGPTDPIQVGPVTTEFSVNIDCANRIATIVGELDFATINLLHEALVALLPVPTPAPIEGAVAAESDRPLPIRVDVSGLRFVDSCGLGALVAARKHQLALGSDLVVVGATGQIAKVFQLGELTSLFG
jgi:anti-anti-sigma factor